MALNMIGDLVFHSLAGPPVFAQQRTVARVRAGVDGKTVKLIGRYGDTWDARTVQFVADFALGVEAVLVYHAAQKNLTNVVYAGVPLATLGHRYFVRDVRILTLEPLLASTTGQLARIEAIWQLEPIQL